MEAVGLQGGAEFLSPPWNWLAPCRECPQLHLNLDPQALIPRHHRNLLYFLSMTMKAELRRP
jgi:hypothetical protein